MDRIGIDALSVFGLPPVEHARVAGELGCRYMSIGLDPVGPNLSNSPPWTLRDAATRRDLIKAMDDHGVSPSLGEGLLVFPDRDVRDLTADVDAMRELGVPTLSILSVDPDLARSLDQLAVLAEMAAAVGIACVIEFVPIFPIPDLPAAIRAIDHIGWDKARILVDTMHLTRSGGTAADIAALPPGRIGYAQINDGPLVPAHDNYLEEAMHERMVPGTGEYPLREIIAALPADIVLGLEIPLRSRLEAGEGARERLRPCVGAVREILAGLETG